jgi:hypothetical protein
MTRGSRIRVRDIGPQRKPNPSPWKPPRPCPRPPPQANAPVDEVKPITANAAMEMVLFRSIMFFPSTRLPQLLRPSGDSCRSVLAPICSFGRRVSGNSNFRRPRGLSSGIQLRLRCALAQGASVSSDSELSIAVTLRVRCKIVGCKLRPACVSA